MIAIVVLLSFAGFTIWYDACVELPLAYKAWEKQTGNPKRLSYEEWNSLRKSEKSNDMVIFMTH